MGVNIVSAQLKMTAYLEGEIDHHNASFIRDEIDNAVMASKPDILIIDFDKVSFMDSSAIGLVMGRYRTLSLYGGKLVVSNLSHQYYKIMKLSGIEKFAKINKRENWNESNK